MNIIGRNEIEALVQDNQWPAISIYLPVSKIGDQQDPIRYKNLVAQARNQLMAAGMRSSEAKSLLEEEYSLVMDSEFWLHLGAEGLAVFISADARHLYALPLSFEETVQTGTRFHIKPLLPLLRHDDFFVLGLNKGGIHLYEGDRFRLREIDLPEGVVSAMDDVLQFDDPERQLQYHTKTGTPGEKRGAMFHGQGVGTDEEKSNIERFFQAVDRGLFPALDQRGRPIVLAGGDELLGSYRKITKSRMILQDGVAGNVADLQPEDLHAKSWDVVSAYLSRDEKEAEKDFRDCLGTGLAAETPETVLRAAYEGRVGTLFVSPQEQVWGVFDTDTMEIQRMESNDNGAVDLLDEAVYWTLCKKGRIYPRDTQTMPCETQVCAQLRF